MIEDVNGDRLDPSSGAVPGGSQGGEDPYASLERALTRARVLPVLRVELAAQAVDAVAQAAAAGLGVVELTATTTAWPEALRTCRARWPELTIGLGTVTSASIARRAIGEGADFLVSPFPCPEVRAEAQRGGTAFLEGGFTPGEVAHAAAHGIAKLFPAHVGGPAYLRDLLSVLPGARIVPTGGIRGNDVADWISAGALAVGIGRALLGSGMAERLAALRATP
jgi:2-dehydro-3-deoxyphosphogluconate aldolase / (4S)-4-hydroxy-2-oxoglutarate aldolase